MIKNNLISYKKIGDICKVVAGGTPSRSNPSFFKGDIPWVKISDMLQGHIKDTEEKITIESLRGSSDKILPVGTVLISIFATIGRTAVLDVPATTNQAILGLMPNNEQEITPDFLKCFLDSKHEFLNRISRGAAQPNINQSIIKGLDIPLLSLDSQKKISQSLEVVRSVIDLRRSAIRKLENLQSAIFHEMFGNIVVNEKNWKLEKLSDVGVLDRGKSRHRPRDSAHLYGGNYPFIQTGDVANCGGLITNFSNTYSEEGLAQSRLWDVDTLCITIAANIAKTGILKIKACFPDSVVGFTVDKTKATNRYVQTWLSFLQPTLEANAPQAAQKNINLQILRSLPIPMPPLELQYIFDEKITQIELMKMKQIEALKKSNELYSSMSAEYFSSPA
jgi:type I restriction enzyme S subunit